MILLLLGRKLVLFQQMMLSSGSVLPPLEDRIQATRIDQLKEPQLLNTGRSRYHTFGKQQQNGIQYQRQEIQLNHWK